MIRECAACHVVVSDRQRCPCIVCGACTTSGEAAGPGCACVPKRQRPRFTPEQLAAAHEMNAALHPDGHCTCGGGGSCEWCQAHCLWCGAVVTSTPCPCGEGAIDPGFAVPTEPISDPGFAAHTEPADDPGFVQVVGPLPMSDPAVREAFTAAFREAFRCPE